MGQVIDFSTRVVSSTMQGSGLPVRLRRILHVDDDEDIRTITKLTLEMIGGYEVHQFSSGAEALAHAAECEPQLFLLDMMMPVMNGEETWSQLLLDPVLKGVPAVFMTAKAERDFADGLLARGAKAVILKPFEPKALCKQIEDVWASLPASASS